MNRQHDAHVRMIEACDREVCEQLDARAPIDKMTIAIRNFSLSQLVPLRLLQEATT